MTCQTFDQAVNAARANIPITKTVVRPEYWCGYTIVQVGEEYRVYDSDAWERPQTPGILPWQPPTGVPVATVDMEGEVTLL